MASTTYIITGLRGRVVVKGSSESIEELQTLLEYSRKLKASLQEAIAILNDIPNTDTRYGETYDLIPKLEKVLNR